MADIEHKGAEAAWGGIGGSGKHAEELMGELVADRRFQELIESKAGELAWGGIGGSGKHAADMEPELKK